MRHWITSFLMQPATMPTEESWGESGLTANMQNAFV